MWYQILVEWLETVNIKEIAKNMKKSIFIKRFRSKLELA